MRLVLDTNIKSYVGSPTAPVGFKFSDTER